MMPQNTETYTKKKKKKIWNETNGIEPKGKKENEWKMKIDSN